MAIFDGASNNLVGGTAGGSGNVISASKDYGVYISDQGTTGNVVEANLIGTDASGTHPLGNGSDGVIMQSGTTNNTIGGATMAQGGIRFRPIRDTACASLTRVRPSNIVEADLIGTDASGTHPLGNGSDGVIIESLATNNTIGGAIPAQGATSFLPTSDSASTSRGQAQFTQSGPRLKHDRYRYHGHKGCVTRQ